MGVGQGLLTSKRGWYLPPLPTRGRQPGGKGAPRGVQMDPRTQAGGTTGVRAVLGGARVQAAVQDCQWTQTGCPVPLARPRESMERDAGNGF